MAEYMSMMGSRREERMHMTGKEVMGDEGVKLASEDYYQQHARVWKFRSENLDDDEFEVAAAGSGWIVEEEDCDNFQRYLTLFNIGPITQQLNKQKITIL